MEQSNQEQILANQKMITRSKVGQQCLVALVRHGERADFAGESSKKWDISFDPPLTQIGISQAEETG